MIDKNAIDPNALNYFRTLKKAGYAAFFVGGAVRDLLLGKTPKDFDIATNATPNQIKRLIPHGKIIGRRFRHVMMERDGGRYEIVTFRGPVVDVEEVDPEMDTDPGRRRFPDLNQFGTAEQDATRRDFTINALFYDPDSDELVDYVGGKKDIDDKMVRTIGSAIVRLKDDPIRILRAIRHKMKLGLEYSPELRQAMYDASPELQNTSKDRIREEFLKVCVDRSLGDFLDEARRMRVIDHIAPWFTNVDDKAWADALSYWNDFKKVDSEQDLPAEVGLSLMVVPLIDRLILASFKPNNSEDRKNLPDIKFFLGSDELRLWLLRNLRISKVQTDTVLRACFYWSRMTGHWLEEGGPPKRIESKLRHQLGALVGAYAAKITLIAKGSPVPDWMQDLAVQLWQKPSRHRNERPDPRQRDFQPNREARPPRETLPTSSNRNETEATSEDADIDEAAPRKSGWRGEPDEPRRNSQALPVLEQPLSWNGPLHAPAMRPVFHEEVNNNWLGDAQSVGYRPSGIPLAPVDKAYVSSKVINNYKPEFSAVEPQQESFSRGPDSERGPRGPRGPRRGGRPERGGRDRNERNRGPRPLQKFDRVDENGPQEGSESRDLAPENMGPQNSFIPENTSTPSPGNQAYPQQNYANDYQDDPYENPDDNIGNRIDGPPTSGYVEASYTQDDSSDLLTSHAKQANNFRRNSGGGQQGGGGGRNQRGGRRRGGRNRRGGRGGGGGGHGHSPQGNRSGNFRDNT